MSGTSTARRFTDKDKARILVTLAANDGNVKRTARECNVQPATIRRWREQDKHGQGPPAELVAETADEFVTDAARVRNLALHMLEEKIIEGSIRASELITTVGVLDDKIRLAKGLPTARTETNPALPAGNQLKELVQGVVSGAIAAAQSRQDEIVEAEIVEVSPLELPPPPAE